MMTRLLNITTELTRRYRLGGASALAWGVAALLFVAYAAEQEQMKLFTALAYLIAGVFCAILARLSARRCVAAFGLPRAGTGCPRSA